MAVLEGINVVFRYRPYSQRGATNAWAMAFKTEDSVSKSKNSSSDPTKDGTIVSPGTTEATHSATSYFADDDERIEELEDCCDNNVLMEIWEANLQKPGTEEGTYRGRYYQGYITSFEKSYPSDGKAELSLEFGLNGVGVAGDVTIPEVSGESGGYDFEDTPKVEDTPIP